MKTEAKLVLAQVAINGAIGTTGPESEAEVEKLLSEGWAVKTVYPLGHGTPGGPPFWILVHFHREVPGTAAVYKRPW